MTSSTPHADLADRHAHTRLVAALLGVISILLAGLSASLITLGVIGDLTGTAGRDLANGLVALGMACALIGIALVKLRGRLRPRDLSLSNRVRRSSAMIALAADDLDAALLELTALVTDARKAHAEITQASADQQSLQLVDPDAVAAIERMILRVDQRRRWRDLALVALGAVLSAALSVVLTWLEII